MSESVERRVLALLDHPTTSPFGIPIPGLSELGRAGAALGASDLRPLDEFVADAAEQPVQVVVRRIGESLQIQARLLSTLRRCGIRPSETVKAQSSPGGFLVGSAGEYAELDHSVASQIWIEGPPRVS